MAPRKSKSGKEKKDDSKRSRKVVEKKASAEEQENIDLGVFADNLVLLFKAAATHGLVQDLKTVDFSSVEPDQVVKVAETVAEAVAASEVTSQKTRAVVALSLFQFKRVDAGVAKPTEGFTVGKLDEEAVKQLNEALDKLFFSVHAINPSVDALMENVGSFLQSTLQMDPATLEQQFFKAKQEGPAPVDPSKVEIAKGSLNDVLQGLPKQLAGSSTFTGLAEKIGSRLAEIRPEIILDAKKDLEDKKVVDQAVKEHEVSADLLKNLFPDLGKLKLPNISAQDIQTVVAELSEHAGDGEEEKGKGKGKGKGKAGEGADKKKKSKGSGQGVQMDQVMSLLGAHSNDLQSIVQEVGDEMRNRIARKELSQEELQRDLQGVMSFLGQMGLGGGKGGGKGAQ